LFVEFFLSFSRNCQLRLKFSQVVWSFEPDYAMTRANISSNSCMEPSRTELTQLCTLRTSNSKCVQHYVRLFLMGFNMMRTTTTHDSAASNIRYMFVVATSPPICAFLPNRNYTKEFRSLIRKKKFKFNRQII
jgi:hypothetical protein